MYYNYRLPIALVISHIFFALLFTIELKTIDGYTIKEKIIWFFIIWFLPIVGLFLFHKDKEKHYEIK